MPPLPLPKLPKLDLFYGGAWHAPLSGQRHSTVNPGNGKVITDAIGWAYEADVDAAVQVAHAAFQSWKVLHPSQRGDYLRRAADALRSNAEELALWDAYNTGNPVNEMLRDAGVAAAVCDYFAGLAVMTKGETIPLAFDSFNFTVREPLGVVARLTAFNHPAMFAAAKIAAPLAAGNTVIIKPSDQAPLSALRVAEIFENIFPPGVVNILPGGKECGQALANHSLVKKITLIGSVATGKAIQEAAVSALKPTLLELGGKNPLIAYPDVEAEVIAKAAIRGMNYSWAGQSCGSTSRVFLHADIHDQVVDLMLKELAAKHKPGIPSDMTTTMGPVVSKVQYDKVLRYIASGIDEGAILATGGRPVTDPTLEGGFFIEPTIFTGVTAGMTIANEEIFGPVCSVFRWIEEDDMFQIVNNVPYGLSAAIYTNNIKTAIAASRRVEAGYVWINNVSRHYLGVPFGGWKESGVGKEECLEKLLSFTRLKSVNVNLV